MTNAATKTLNVRTRAEGRIDGRTKAARATAGKTLQQQNVEAGARVNSKKAKTAKPTGVKLHVTRVSKYPYKSDAMKGQCTCGCGESTRGGMFVQGHDAKLKSTLLSISRKEEGFKPSMVAKVTILRADQIGFLRTMPELAKVVDAAS